MKSSSPFDWKAKPASLFTLQEKASMNQFAVTTDTTRKQAHIYSKAIPNVFQKSAK